MKGKLVVQKLMEMLFRRKRTIVVSFILVTLTVVVGNMLLEPIYRAGSKVLVEPAQNKRVGVGMGANGSVSTFLPGSVAPVEKVLNAPGTIVDEIVSRLQLRDGRGRLMASGQLINPGFAAGLTKTMFASPYVFVERKNETGILSVVATSPHPREAAMIADCLAEVVVDKIRGEIKADFKTAQAAVSSQLETIKDEYTSNLRAVADVQKSQESVDVETETVLAAKKMGDLLKQKEETLVALAEVRTKLDELKNQGRKADQEVVALSALEDSKHVTAIKEKLTQLRLELAAAASDFTEEHPKVRALREQIATAEEELESELAIYRSAVPEIAGLEKELLSLGARMKAIDENIAQHARSLNQLPDKAFKQASFDMELKAGPEAYSSLLDSRHALQMAEVGSLGGIGIVEPAKVPAVPVFPKKGLNTVLGMCAGFFLGLAIAFIREYFDDTIKSADDVKALRPAATIGAVPLIETKQMALISGRDPNDPLYESYRWIRSHFDVIDHIRNKRLRSVLISSAGPNEGKSTTVVNLGISIAREGRKVVVVDTDLRRPSLDNYLDVPNDIGLSDWLQGRCLLGEIKHKTAVNDLMVIPSGPPVTDPGQLLESEKMGELMATLEGEHDLVILDSAPLLIKADALALAKWVQGTVMVLESEKTTRRALSEMMSRVARVPAQPLGFVLNKCPVRRGRYSYDRYYRQTYTGQPESTTPVLETPQDEVIHI